MTEVNLIEELDLFDGWSIKLNTSPYVWSESTQTDITSDVFRLTVDERINNFHIANFTLRNTGKQYTYTGSDYYIMDEPRVNLTLGDRTFKFTLINATPSVEEDLVMVQMFSSSYDLNGAIAQIRVQPSSDGNFYLEDVVYRALYDTGMHNFFLIEMSDGSYYNTKTANDIKTRVDYDDDIVYMRTSVIEVIRDICSKAGCIWYESDLSTSDQYSVLNFVKMETDFDAPSDKTLTVSTANNTTSISPQKGFDTISNLIYYDELPFFIAEHDSIDDHGIRSPRMIKFDEDSGDSIKYHKTGLSLRSIIKDPIVSFPLTVKGLTDIGSLDRFVKIVDSTNEFDYYAGVERKFRINSVNYNIDKNVTKFTVGNEYRKIIEEKLETLSSGSNKNNKDSNEKQMIGKGPQDTEMRCQIYTEGSMHDDTFTYTSGGYGVRIGIDTAYSSSSSNAKIYFEDDGIRTGN